MTVTRREMLTAASAIGIAAGLTNETKAAFRQDVTVEWFNIPSNYGQHLEEAASLVRTPCFDHFQSFDVDSYTEFFRVFAAQHHATVNGLYLGSQNPPNLTMVYSIRTTRGSDAANTDFVLHSFGGRYGSPQLATEKLHLSIDGWFTGLNAPGPKTTKIHYRHLLAKSFSGEVLRFIARNGAPGEFRLGDDGNGYWTLTIVR